MRKRYQKGSLRKVDGFWIAQWWEQGHRRKRWLGRVSELTKTQAQTQLAEILSPINSASAEASAECEFGDFVNNVFLPFYERKWKRSTAMTNKDRIRFHVCSEFAPIPVDRFTRDQLQRFLDAKSNAGLSFSTVDHLRWDLSQIFKMAVAETYISKNPARLLFTPREARRFEKRIMNLEEVRTCFSVLELRERLITKLAILAGMRPGEIFAMKRSRLKPGQAEIKQRLYRGDIDSPKTVHSIRTVALSRGTAAEIEAWNASGPDTNPDAWVFPSEEMTTSLTKDNVWSGVGTSHRGSKRQAWGELSGHASDALFAHERAEG